MTADGSATAPPTSLTVLPEESGRYARTGVGPALDGLAIGARRAGSLTTWPQINDTHEHLSAIVQKLGQPGGERYALSGVSQHALVHEVGLNEDGHRAVSGFIPGLPHRSIVDML